MRRYGLQSSPDRTKVWIEPPPQHHQQEQPQGRKVPVVYYLCKNGHLEHPHFIEVPLSSNEGLYLRDVINRLNKLRGKGMAAKYSWSCKRSYKNGFVWHDLSEDDLIHPAQDNEYVLKGSELLDQSPPDRRRNVSCNAKIHHDKHHQQDYPVLNKPEEDSSSSSLTTIVKVEKVSSLSTPPPLDSANWASSAPVRREDESSPCTFQSGSSGDLSPKPSARTAPSSAMGSPVAIVYRNCKTTAAHDASTQTEDSRNTADVGDTRIIGVSTDDESLDIAYNERQRKCIPQPKQVPEIVAAERSPGPTSSNTSSSCGRTSTLESLIRDEINRRKNLRIVEEEEVFVPTKVKLKATDMLIQLISCGSIAVKDHYSLGFVPTYRPRFDDEIDCLSESQKVIGLRPQEEYRIGEMVGAKNYEEAGGVSDLRRSTSFDEDRSCKISNSKRDKDKAVDAIQSRCLPRTINIVSCKHSKNDMNETTMSPVLDTRVSSVGPTSCRPSPIGSSKIGSNRIIDSSSVKGSSMRFESFGEEKEKVIKIEERLSSGARVVIQCRSPCYDEDESLN